MKTQKQIAHARRHRKRYFQKHPEKVLIQLQKWVAKEKNPKEKKRAEKILARHLKEFEQKKIDVKKD